MQFDVIFSADAHVTACVTVEASNDCHAVQLAESQPKDWEVQSVRHVEVSDVMREGKPNRKWKK
jgi:hypothetical protein